MSRGASFTVALLAIASIFGPARAADLGGNCCADLEQRIAELERWATLTEFATHPPFILPSKQLMLRILPVGSGASFAEAVANSGEFAQQLLSCRSDGDGEDATRFVREGQCVWTRGRVRRDDNTSGPLAKHFRETATTYSAGGQIDLGQRWFIGAAAGVSRSELSVLNGNETESTRIYLGAVVKYNPGPWLFAASVTGGWGNLDNSAYLNPGSNIVLATSNTNINYVTANFTGAYVAELAGAYLKPQVNVAVSRVERDAYIEPAAAGPALTITASEETIVTLSPALELGTELRMASGSIRPYIRAGVTWRSDADFVTTALLNEVVTIAVPVTTAIDQVTADVAAGLDLIAPEGFVLRFEYDGRFGSQTEQHAGSAKFSMPY